MQRTTLLQCVFLSATNYSKLLQAAGSPAVICTIYIALKTKHTEVPSLVSDAEQNKASVMATHHLVLILHWVALRRTAAAGAIVSWRAWPLVQLRVLRGVLVIHGTPCDRN